MKEELGLDHFEGRSWMGLHRHALLTMIAYAFLQHRRLSQAKRGKKDRRSTAPTEPAGRAPSHSQPAHPRTEEHTSELQSLMRIQNAVLCLQQNNTYTSTELNS